LHRYSVQLEWTGNLGPGTSSYRAYSRDHLVRAGGKAELAGSSDPAFRGDATRWNPEELLVAALSQCHLLAYLHLAATAGVIVCEYRDDAVGELELNRDGTGRMRSVELRPRVVVAAPDQLERAQRLHEPAHHNCFIAASVNFPVTCVPTATSP